MCKGPVAGGSRGHFKELKEASVARAQRAGEGAGVLGISRKWSSHQSSSLELCSVQNELGGESGKGSRKGRSRGRPGEIGGDWEGLLGSDSKDPGEEGRFIP